MPQVWLTYAELGALFGADEYEGRIQAMAMEYPRRRCSDGLTRVKLSETDAHAFMLLYAKKQEPSALDALADTMVESLRGMLPATSTSVSEGDQRQRLRAS